LTYILFFPNPSPFLILENILLFTELNR